MKIIPTYDVAPFENPHGVDGRKLFLGDNLQFIRLTLKPGEVIAPHSANVDVFFYVAAGNGVCLAGDNVTEVQADTLIYSNAGTVHGWQNTGNTDLKLLVCKAGMV